MAEEPENSNKALQAGEVAYLAGRRDALHTFYAVAMGRPNLLREEIIELLRQAVLDADRKLRDAPRTQEVENMSQSKVLRSAIMRNVDDRKT